MRGALPRRATLLLLAAFVFGCAPGRAAGPPPGRPPAPGSPAPALRVLGKGRIEAAGEVRRFEAAVALEHPDRLLAEISGPVGGTRAVLTMRGGRVLVVFPAERSYLEEEASPALFESLVGLRVDAAGLMTLLAALDETASTVEVPTTHGRLVLTREEDRLVAVAEPPGRGGVERLEVTVRELTRLQSGELPGDLFDIAPRPGWRRLTPDQVRDGGLLLLP